MLAGPEQEGIHKPDPLKWQDRFAALMVGTKVTVLEGKPAYPEPFVFPVSVLGGYPKAFPCFTLMERFGANFGLF